MSTSGDLETIFGPLRSNAEPCELVGEVSTIDAMVHAHEASKGRITMFSSTRRNRFATLLAAGVIGFGGVAAAGPGGFSDDSFDALVASVEEPPVGDPTVEDPPVDPTTDDPTTDDPTTDDPTTDEPTTDEPTTDEPTTDEPTTDEPTTDEPSVEPTVEDPAVDPPTLVDDPDTAFDETTCLPGNHGATVSAVARGDDRFDGVEVRDAAQSSCGKSADSESDDEGDDGDDGDGGGEIDGGIEAESAEGAEDKPKAERPAGPPAHAKSTSKAKDSSSAERPGNSGNNRSTDAPGKSARGGR